MADPRRPHAGRLARVERQLGAAAERALDEPARVQHLGHDVDVVARAAVRRAGEREVAGPQPEALEHARAHAAERLQRLDRGAGEHRQVGVGPADRAAGLDDAPGDAVLGLHRAAPQGDHAGQGAGSRRRSRASSMIFSATSRSYQPSTWTSLPSGCL